MAKLLSDDEVFGSGAPTKLLSDEDVFTPRDNTKPTLTDYAKGFASGTNQMVSGIGYLAENAGATNVGKVIREVGDTGQKYWSDSMTPAGRRAAESQVFEDDPNSSIPRLGERPGQALAMGVAQSAPSMLAAAVPGGIAAFGLRAGAAQLATRGIGGALAPLAAGTAAPVGTWGANLAGHLAARAPTALGFGAAEGAVAGATNAAQFKTQVEQMPETELAKMPGYAELAAQVGPSAARAQIAEQGASDIMWRTTAATGGIGAVTGGGAMGSAFQRVTTGAKGGIAGAVLRDAGKEAMQEIPQSGGERYIQNLAARDYLDPNQNPTQGVVADALSGGAVGAALGAVSGAGSHLVPKGPVQKALDAAAGTSTGSTGTSTGSTGTSTGTSTGAPASDEIGLPVTGVRADASVHDLVQAAAAEDTAQQAPAGVGARQSPSGGTIAPPAPTAPVTSAPSDESRAADAEPPQPNTPAAPEPVSAPVSTAVISPQTSQAEPAGVPPSTTEGVSSNVSQTQEAVSPAPGREAQSAEAADAAEAEREWRDFVANEGRDLGPRRLAVIREQFMARRKMDSGIEEATGRVAAGRQQQAAANRMAILDDLPMTTTGNTVRRFAAALRDAGISDSRVSVDERKLIARRIAARDTLQPLEQEPQNELTVPERTAKQAQPTMPRMDALRRKAALPGVRIVGARMLDRYGRRIATLTTDEAAELSPAGMSPKSVSGTSGMPKGIPKESDAELDSLIAEESRDLGRRRLTLLSLQAISRQKQISAADKAELDALIAAEQQDVAKRRGMLSELQAIARQKISEALDSATKLSQEGNVSADISPDISAQPGAQHIEGKTVEPATPAVVSQAVAKGARNAGKDLRQEQSDLLKQIDEAIKKAPAEYDDATGFVTFDVPGDGKFKVRNNAVRLANFRKNIVAAAAGFRPEPKRAAHKTPMQKIEGGKASPQTIRDMLDDGDLTAALELAKTAGIPVVFSNTPGAAPILLTEAQKFDLPGFKSFDMVSARQSVVGRLWSVVEISTGLWVSTGKTRAAAERLAADRLVKNGPQKFAEAIEQNRDSGKDQATLESEWSKWAEKEENDKDDAAALKQRRDDAKAAALAADRAKWEEFTGEKPDFAPHARNPLDPAYMNPVATLADYEKARKHGKGSEFIDYAESKLDGDIAGHKPVLALLNRLRNNNVGGWSYLGNEGAGGIPRYERTVKTQDGREIRATIDGDVSAYGFVRENDVIKAKIGDVGSPTFRQAREQADQVIDALMAPVTKRAPGVAATPVVERETPVGETQASRVVTPDSLNLLRNPVGNGDTVQFADGSKWVAKEGWTGGTGAWTLLQGRMAHPTVRGVKGQAEFIRAIIDADNASAATQKPASTPEIPEGIPPTVAASVQRALENLREVERILADVEKVRGKGHILAIEVRDQQEAIQSARAKLDKFRGMAKGKGLDADAVIAGMGGEPDLGRFGSPAAADDAGAAKAQTNTEDSGSELTYNRRNRLTRGLKWEDIADKDEALRVKEATKAKVYPKPDYKAMIESGMRQQLAHIVKQVYDSIAAAPRTRAGGAPTDQDIKNYIAGVNRVMDAAIEWSGDADRGGKWLATTVANNSRKFGSIIDVMSMAGAKDTGKSLLSGAFPGGYEPVRGELTAIGGNKVYAALQPSRTELGEAMLAIKAGWPEPQEAWQRQGIKVINGDDVKAETYVGEKGVHVWIKAKDGDTSRSVKSVFIEGATSASSPDVKSFIDKSLAEFSGRFALLDKLRRLVGTHATEDEAKAAARALVSKSASKQTVSDKGISVLAASRTGIDRRMPGEDISSDRLRDTFKFRGINFGNWMKGDTNAKERQLHLNHAYDSFMDLADMLGVPPEAMSLNGMLGVAIGAQGNGGRAAAHFVPGVNEINLTRESGAGSLAHEWGHALDHYFARQSGLTRETDPFLTTHLRTATGSEIRPEILDKFKTIVQAMLKRRMTQQEREAKAKRGIADAVVQIGRWLREPLLDRGLTDDADVAQAVAKIKAGDLGDGTVAVSSRSVVRSAVHDLAMLVKNKSGKKLSVDTMIGVNAQAERVKYLREALSGDADHVPQQMVSTQYAENAKSLDAAKGGRPYWSTSLEMFARAFDAFVSDTLEARAAKNTYLSHAGRSGETVPTGAERTAINASIQGLVDAVETRPGENGNVVLYNVAADEYSGMRDAIEQAIASKKDVRKFRDGGPIDDADSYFDAIGKAISADKVVADRIAEISDDAFAVSAMTRDGRMVALTRSARRPGKYQITRFGRDGAPWGDTQHDSKIGAAKEFVGDVDVSTIKVSDGINYNAAAPANITPADSAIYSMAQDGKTAAEILSFIGRTSRRPFNRYLANALRNLGAASTITLDSQGGFAFGNRSYAQTYAAAYNPRTDTVALFTPREAERHVLHELVHAATLKAIAAGGASSMRMRRLFAHVQRSGRLNGQYGMSNLDEFVAEAFSNPAFQEALRNVPAPAGSRLKNAWRWFVRLVSRVLGLRTQAMETALDRALTEGASLMLENAGLTGGVDGVRNSQIAAPYHRFTDGGPDTGVGYMLFGEDQERVRHYGKNHYTFDPASLPASAVVYAGSAKFRSELIGALNRHQEILDDYQATAEQLADEANSSDIVDSAGIWDAPEIVNIINAEVLEPNGWRAVETENGAVVFDKSAVKSGDNGQDTRFSSANALPDTITVDGVERPTTNSKGQPIAQDEEGLRNFWRWFAGSEVVDEQGRPLVVYHGTKETFSAFDIDLSEQGVDGIWLTDTGGYASWVASGGPGGKARGNVMDLYLRAENPMTFDVLEEGRRIADQIGEARPESAHGAQEVIAGGMDWDTVVSDMVSEAKAGGHDSLIIESFNDGYLNDSNTTTAYVAFSPRQIKSATGNTGQFSPDNPDIRFNVAGTPPVSPGNAWQRAKAKAAEILSPKNLDKVIYELQDKYVDLRRLRDHIRAIGGTITDLNDAYLGEELYHKRLAHRTQDFLKADLRPLLGDMRARGVGMKDLETFLHARHAPEANAEMAKRNPNQAEIDAGRGRAAAIVHRLEQRLQHAQARGLATAALERALNDARGELVKWNGAQAFRGTEEERRSLSGLSDAAAAAIMNGLTPERRADLDALAARVDAINEGTLQLLQDYGLMSRESLGAWRKTYRYYIPLHRDEAHPDSANHPVGHGFSVKGDAAKRRTGSNQQVTHILGHIAMQREAALTRGEKNHVMLKLYLMARQNPLADVWKVGAVPTTDTIDKATGFVKTVPDPLYRNRPNVLTLRIAGKDVAIVMNEHNPQALRMAQALKNLDVDDLHYIIPIVGKATRYFASINTQYNPIFGVINLMRDAQEAALNLSTTELAGKQGQVMGDAMSILKEVVKNKGRMPTAGRWGRLFEEFNEVGGTTGYRDLYLNAADRAKALLSELQALDRGKASQAAHAVASWLSDYNEAMENSVRLAAYRAALDNGMSRERAASLAKNLTVNFNRKGRQTRELGALYAFFNAAVQGTTRMAQTLAGPAGRKIMAGGVLLGAMNALLGIAVMGGGGDDDDEWEKIPEFVKERSIVIPIGRQDYVSIPMPLGFQFLPNIGRLAVEMAVYKDKTLGKQMASLVTVLADAFNPLGGSSPALQIAAPTVLDPFVALAQNKDWTGKPIYIENRNSLDPQPGTQRSKDSATPWAKGFAEAINAVSGGTEYTPGGWSPTPDQIDYVIGQLTGGLGREAGKVAATAAAPFTGEELPPYKIPLAGRLYGSTAGHSGQSAKFYENVTKANEVENEIKGRVRQGISVADYLADNPGAIDLAARGNVAERQVAALRKARHDAVTKGGPGEVTKVRDINERMAGVMRNFNREADAIGRKSAQ